MLGKVSFPTASGAPLKTEASQTQSWPTQCARKKVFWAKNSPVSAYACPKWPLLPQHNLSLHLPCPFRPPALWKRWDSSAEAVSPCTGAGGTGKGRARCFPLELHSFVWSGFFAICALNIKNIWLVYLKHLVWIKNRVLQSLSSCTSLFIKHRCTSQFCQGDKGRTRRVYVHKATLV